MSRHPRSHSTHDAAANPGDDEPNADHATRADDEPNADPAPRSNDVRTHQRRRRFRFLAAGVALLAAAGGTALALTQGDNAQPIPTALSRQDNRASRGERRPLTGTPTTPPSATASATRTAKPAVKPTPRRTATTKPTAKIAIPASCSAYSGNRAIACALLPSYGFTLSQMPALDTLWQHESGWSHTAYNSGSGAYGIPQALPGSKMGTVASDWRTNPATQIKWGLSYIKGRYGSPINAWAFWQSHNWY